MSKRGNGKKHHYAPPYFMNPIEPITVAVIGAGGTGSLVMQMLARIHITLIGLGHVGLFVKLIDGDKVEETNVGRQMFSVADIGEFKSIALITKINRFFNINWVAVAKYYDASHEIHTQNIVITCVDNLETRVMIGEHLKQRRSRMPEYTAYYWLDTGNTATTGQIILGSLLDIVQPKKNCTKKLKTRFELFPAEEVDEQKELPSCNLAQALGKQDLFINQFIATYTGQLLWGLLRKNVIDYQGVFINTSTLEVTKIPIT